VSLRACAKSGSKGLGPEQEDIDFAPYYETLHVAQLIWTHTVCPSDLVILDGVASLLTIRLLSRPASSSRDGSLPKSPYKRIGSYLRFPADELAFSITKRWKSSSPVRLLSVEASSSGESSKTGESGRFL
jgi:hypothetical protein